MLARFISLHQLFCYQLYLRMPWLSVLHCLLASFMAVTTVTIETSVTLALLQPSILSIPSQPFQHLTYIPRLPNLFTSSLRNAILLVT